MSSSAAAYNMSNLLMHNRLGVTESGLFPGVVYYLSMWYKRDERQYRISLFFSCASLAGAFGGILAWGIAHMRNVGGYNGWRWIFILVRPSTFHAACQAYNLIGGSTHHCHCHRRVLVHLQLPRNRQLAIQRRACLHPGPSQSRQRFHQ